MVVSGVEDISGNVSVFCYYWYGREVYGIIRKDDFIC